MSPSCWKAYGPRRMILTIFDKANIIAVVFPLGIWITLLAQRRWCSLFSSLHRIYTGRLYRSWYIKELSNWLSDSSFSVIFSLNFSIAPLSRFISLRNFYVPLFIATTIGSTYVTLSFRPFLQYRTCFYNIELFQQSRQTANTIKKSFNLQLFCISFDWRLKALNIICDYRWDFKFRLGNFLQGIVTDRRVMLPPVVIHRGITTV